MAAIPDPARQELAARVQKCVALRCAISPTTPLALAVSGGADSVALGELLFGWQTISAVLFVDHGLREVRNERDAAAEAAERIGAPFREVRLEVRPGGNLQARARTARYQALKELAPEGSLIATGHTRTDQAETVLQRILRGSGISGLAGLAPRRGRIVRPLLDISRAETRAVATSFVDDPTNATPRFQRNRIRQWIEALGSEQAGVEQALSELATSAATSTQLLDAIALAVPDLDLRGLDGSTVTTFLHHLARVATGGHSVASRKALSSWADALATGGIGRVSLGDALAGRFHRGRASLERDADPRSDVVAPRPGHYHGAVMRLSATVTNQATRGGTDAFDVPLETVRWPLKLVRMPGGRRAQAESLAETDGQIWQVVDETGRALGPGEVDMVAGSPTENRYYIRVAFGPRQTSKDSPLRALVLASGSLTDASLSEQSEALGLPEASGDPTETRALYPCGELHVRSGRSS